MTHIKHILANTIANASKAKLYHQNRDIFLKYFDSIEQYEALISAGNFKKIDEIIKQNSSFNLDEFINNQRERFENSINRRLGNINNIVKTPS